MSLPYESSQAIQITTPEQVYSGLDAWCHKLAGKYHSRLPLFKQLQKRSMAIHERSLELSELSEKQLQKKITTLREVFRCRRDSDTDIDEAFAVIAEISFRSMAMRPYPVQLMGGLCMQQGFLIEMSTGEGKSLTAAISAIIPAWAGRPCHVLTVNDYLAARDAEESIPLFKRCGLTVGSAIESMKPEELKTAYRQNVVYTTAKQLLADFLKDRITLSNLDHPGRQMLKSLGRSTENNLLLNGIDTAIIDEADSILVDEAVSPLIISQPKPNKMLEDAILSAHKIVSQFQEIKDFTAEHTHKTVTFTQSGVTLLKKLKEQLPPIWQGEKRRQELITQALSGRLFFHRDKQYVVEEGKIVIVDEYTGRLMPSRSWSHGLHQAVEAKEGLEISPPSETIARLSFQNFFRLFNNLSGMTGTAGESAQEFWQIYRLPIMSIPNHRTPQRQEWPVRIFKDRETKWQAVEASILKVHQTGRPILVGMRSVKDSEELAERLTNLKLDFDLLNATKHEEEAEIVSRAGHQGKITIATNIAGRGTDIKLPSDIKELGGLHVIITEGNESARVDRQLIGRCGRQGDPGSHQLFIAPCDEMIEQYGSKFNKLRLKRLVTSEASKTALKSEKILKQSQSKAEKMAYGQRKNILQMDTWLEDSLSFGQKSRN